MISKIPTYSLKGIKVSRPFLIFLLLLIAVYFGFLINYPFNTLLATGCFYLSLIPISFVHFKNIKNLMSASYEDLIEIRDVGNNTAKNIVDFFNNEKNVNLVEKLIDKGLIFSIQEKNNKSSKLENLTFVYSGTFSVSRDDLKKMIEENGGKVITALSKSISYLIVGDNMGPAKKEKALKDNIKMISEEEFYELLK